MDAESSTSLAKLETGFAEEKSTLVAEKTEALAKLAAAEAKVAAFKTAQEEHVKSRNILAAEVPVLAVSYRYLPT